MALIILDEGESFEHYHADPSQTLLVEGSAELHMDGAVRLLALGVPVQIPVDTPHKMRNIGSGKASINCLHTDPPPTVHHG